jgi:non-ribosomal peptide synthetase component F
MIAGAFNVGSYVASSAEDTILAVLPFSFDAGFGQLSQGFTTGSTVVLMDYLLLLDMLKAAVKYQATGLARLPALWNRLVQPD